MLDTLYLQKEVLLWLVFSIATSLFWQPFLIYQMDFCILNILYPSNNTNCEWANTTTSINTNVELATTTTTAKSYLEY